MNVRNSFFSAFSAKLSPVDGRVAGWMRVIDQFGEGRAVRFVGGVEEVGRAEALLLCLGENAVERRFVGVVAPHLKHVSNIDH